MSRRGAVSLQTILLLLLVVGGLVAVATYQGIDISKPPKITSPFTVEPTCVRKPASVCCEQSCLAITQDEFNNWVYPNCDGILCTMSITCSCNAQPVYRACAVNTTLWAGRAYSIISTSGCVMRPNSCGDGICSSTFMESCALIENSCICPEDCVCDLGQTHNTTCPDGTSIITESCLNNSWVATNNTCPVPVVCTAGQTQTSTCPDGSVIVVYNCVDNAWVLTNNVCPVEPEPECVSGAIMQSTCWDNSTIIISNCVSGQWIETTSVCPTVPVNETIPEEEEPVIILPDGTNYTAPSDDEQPLLPTFTTASGQSYDITTIVLLLAAGGLIIYWWRQKK